MPGCWTTNLFNIGLMCVICKFSQNNAIEMNGILYLLTINQITFLLIERKRINEKNAVALIVFNIYLKYLIFNKSWNKSHMNVICYVTSNTTDSICIQFQCFFLHMYVKVVIFFMFAHSRYRLISWNVL